MKCRQALKIIRQLGWHRFTFEKLSNGSFRIVAYNKRMLRGYRPETICRAWSKPRNTPKLVNMRIKKKGGNNE